MFNSKWNDVNKLSHFSKNRDVDRNFNNELILEGILKNDELIQKRINENCLKKEEIPCKKHKFVGGLGTNFTLISYKPCFHYINYSLMNIKKWVICTIILKIT